MGLSIRVLKDRRLGFSFTTSLEKEAIKKAVESAVEIASSMPEDENNGFHAFGSSVYPNVDAYDPDGMKVSLEKKIEIARQLEAECLKADSRITGIHSASISETLTEQHLVDSNGEDLYFQNTLYNASITCKAEQAGEAQLGCDFDFSNYLDHLDVAGAGRRAATKATELLQSTRPPTFVCPAILRNDVVANLLEFLAESFSAEAIDQGRSLLANRLGERIFSEQITLIDDGLLPGGYGTAPFDAEGIPSRKTVLVDAGFFNEALYDLYYANKHGKASTGNSVRAVKSPPTIGFSNLYIKGGRSGKRSFQQLFDGIDKGILITDLHDLGGIRTANPVTGDFSLGASGILIEKGKLTRPVRGFAVAGNVLELFQKVTDISNDLRFFGNVGAPSVRVSELSVSGA